MHAPEAKLIDNPYNEEALNSIISPITNESKQGFNVLRTEISEQSSVIKSPTDSGAMRQTSYF